MASAKKGDLADSMGSAFLPLEDGNDAYPTARARMEAWVLTSLTVQPAEAAKDLPSSPSEACRWAWEGLPSGGPSLPSFYAWVLVISCYLISKWISSTMEDEM